MEIKKVYQNDLDLKNNPNITVVPQVMTNDADEFIFASRYVLSLGYKEINWNLGCPYPMVTNRCLGSGLITEVERIEHILDRVHTETDITVSMKMRMGYDNPLEIIDSFPILNKFPLRNIAIHARIGKQLYKGGVDLDGFQRCVESTDHVLYYNGDITSVEYFNMLTERFPSVKHWMIGRGLIADPFLPNMIRSGEHNYPPDRGETFRQFHNALFYEFEKKLKGEKHVIMKMSSYWDYFSQAFPDQLREIKKIKKTKNIADYDRAFDEFCGSISSY